MSEPTSLHSAIRTAVVSLGVPALATVLLWSGKVTFLGSTSVLRELDEMKQTIDSQSAEWAAESVFTVLQGRIAPQMLAGIKAVFSLDTLPPSRHGALHDSLITVLRSALLDCAVDSAQLEVIDVPALSRGGQLLWKASRAQLATERRVFDVALSAAMAGRRRAWATSADGQAMAATEAVLLANSEWEATAAARLGKYNALIGRFNADRQRVIWEIRAAAFLFPLSLYAMLWLVMYAVSGRWRLPGFRSPNKPQQSAPDA
jgi:hypothetical protein